MEQAYSVEEKSLVSSSWLHQAEFGPSHGVAPILLTIPGPQVGALDPARLKLNHLLGLRKQPEFNHVPPDINGAPAVDIPQGLEGLYGIAPALLTISEPQVDTLDPAVLEPGYVPELNHRLGLDYQVSGVDEFLAVDIFQDLEGPYPIIPVLLTTFESQVNVLGPNQPEDESNGRLDLLESDNLVPEVDEIPGIDIFQGINGPYEIVAIPLIALEPQVDAPHPNISGPDHQVPGANEPPVVDIPNGNQRNDPPNDACNKKCKGDLLGPHRCQRPQKNLRIECLGSNNCRKPFRTKNDFNRHCKSVHVLGKLLDCTVPGCNKVGRNGFSRRDNLLQHLRSVHNEEIVVKKFRCKGSRVEEI